MSIQRHPSMRQAGQSPRSPAAKSGSAALQIVAGMKTRATRAHRMTVLERCKQINEEMQKESAAKRQLMASIILDGVIDIDDCTETYS